MIAVKTGIAITETKTGTETVGAEALLRIGSAVLPLCMTWMLRVVNVLPGIVSNMNARAAIAWVI